MFQIKELKTEYRVNPLGIGTARPRFLWAFTADTDEKQTAYRVVVTSRGKTLWDSGKVASPPMRQRRIRGGTLGEFRSVRGRRGGMERQEKSGSLRHL